MNLMAVLTISKLDAKTMSELRRRASCNGRSIEQEAKMLLRSALNVPAPKKTKQNLAGLIRLRFAPFGGVDVDLEPRDAMRNR